ncbi:MAG: acid phosphatase/vanadium-dependent haloperoxidase related protein [Candidatus Saccharibacteria bacterium]|nr:acid phosphatase/vanadium-dependent haloperoxidase related protein [Candidatus Saccharibacteria bacterium]
MSEISPYLYAVAAGWIVAQGAKYVIVVARTRNLSHVRQLYLSGNMPSAHSATTIALLTVIGLKDGVGTGLFGLASLFTAIVMYDSLMVRRSVGEQGLAIQALIKEGGSKVAKPRAAKGHTPLEVVVGAAVGLVVGLVVFFATK